MYCIELPHENMPKIKNIIANRIKPVKKLVATGLIA